MENQNQATIVSGTPAMPSVDSVAQDMVPSSQEPSRVSSAAVPREPSDVFVRKIVTKIKSSENILVVLSRNPSVDEISAAIGLTLFLDSLQKHTTAIYSGATPDALKFLHPEETFATNTDSLRDFIIALDKEKADHLRYKLDGDYVKVFITPYKSNITEQDLEFSHGDFNVNLVLAVNVPSAADLDAALTEPGRVIRDATTVDITVADPGKFAELEWSDSGASSVSEMVAKIVFALQGDDAVLDKDTATALLTGIVAATGRFSNNRTSSETLQLASELMSMGADQQLISAHVIGNDSGAYNSGTTAQRTDLVVSHEGMTAHDGTGGMPAAAQTMGVETQVVGADATASTQPVGQLTTVNLALTGAVNPAEAVSSNVTETSNAVEPSQAELIAAASAAVNEAMAMAAANGAAVNTANAAGTGAATGAGVSQTAQLSTVDPMTPANDQKDYAQMMAQALTEPIPAARDASTIPGMMVPDVLTTNTAPSVAVADTVTSGTVPSTITDNVVTPGAVSTVMPDATTSAVTSSVMPGAVSSTMVSSTNPAAQAAPAEVKQSGPEPIAKPEGVTLPPPPTPMPTADMMPPTLPKTAVQSDAFQIPGVS